MSFTTVLLLAVGFLLGVVLVHLFSSLHVRRLRTIPKPPTMDSETFNTLNAEVRAGFRLQKACYNNDPKAASEALILWAWASGEPAVVNGLDGKMDVLRQPELQRAITDLWFHLDSQDSHHWFGDALWNAFLDTNPDFESLESSG